MTSMALHHSISRAYLHSAETNDWDSQCITLLLKLNKQEITAVNAISITPQTRCGSHWQLI